VALLRAQAREAHGRLAAAAVLLGQVHRELVQYVARVALHRAVQRALAVHHDEAEAGFVLH
jgi:anthranilate phosphoribosyltransferase